MKRDYSFIKQQVQELALENFKLYPNCYEGIDGLLITEDALSMCDTLGESYYEHRTENEIENEAEFDITVEDYKDWCRSQYQSYMIKLIEEKIEQADDFEEIKSFSYEEIKDIFQERIDDEDRDDSYEEDGVHFNCNWDFDESYHEDYISFIELVTLENATLIFADTDSGFIGNHISEEWDLVQEAGGNASDYAKLKGANICVNFGEETHYFKR